MNFDFSIIFNGKTFLVLLKAYGITLGLTFGALALGIVIGTMLAVFKVLPQKNIVNKILSRFADIYLAVIRGTPLLVQLFIIYFIIFYGTLISPYIVAIVGFGINSGAYVCEIMRGGILGVDRGQMEAGRSLGLSYGQTMGKIILPQSVKNILPALGNEAITLVKETSVAVIVGVSEFFSEIKAIATATYNMVTPYLFAAVVYLVTVFIMATLLKKMEKRLRKSEGN